MSSSCLYFFKEMVRTVASWTVQLFFRADNPVTLISMIWAVSVLTGAYLATAIAFPPTCSDVLGDGVTGEHFQARGLWVTQTLQWPRRSSRNLASNKSAPTCGSGARVTFKGQERDPADLVHWLMDERALLECTDNPQLRLKTQHREKVNSYRCSTCEVFSLKTKTLSEQLISKQRAVF